VKRFRQEDGKLVLINPKLGDYPNPRQIRRVPVSGPEASLKGSFALHTSAASCPQETFTISAVEAG